MTTLTETSISVICIYKSHMILKRFSYNVPGQYPHTYINVHAFVCIYYTYTDTNTHAPHIHTIATSSIA